MGYIDGLNLYCGYFIVNDFDPSGLGKCKKTSIQADPKKGKDQCEAGFTYIQYTDYSTPGKNSGSSRQPKDVAYCVKCQSDQNDPCSSCKIPRSQTERKEGQFPTTKIICECDDKVKEKSCKKSENKPIIGLENGVLK